MLMPQPGPQGEGMPSRYIILLMVLVPFLTLFAEQYFLGRVESPSVGAVAAVFLLIFLNVWWVLRDSAERNVTVPYYLKILVASGAVIGLPIYLFRSRRFPGGLLAMAIAICIGLLLIASAAMGALVGEQAATFFDQTPKHWSRCSGQDNVSLDSRIASCTTMIDSLRAWKHKKSADALFQRGRAYHEKGDRERASADLTRAYGMRMDPKLEKAICEFSHQADLSIFLCGARR